MNINQYLDSTYLKTAEQAGISEKETIKKIEGLTLEAIENNFKLVMIRPEYVALVRKLISKVNSKVLVGTVIDFPNGKASINKKLKEAKQAIKDGADELDFVVNYSAIINDDLDLIKNEIIQGTKLVLEHKKIIKWIIEIAALSTTQIAAISKFIRNIILENFNSSLTKNVFIKSSTGFYKTENGKPNGATIEAVKIMLTNAHPLLVKAAGGVKSYNDAIKMINLGVLRIGTSSAKLIVEGGKSNNIY